MSDLHLSDVQTLRERARQHVENGAVTESYSANREEVLRLLCLLYTSPSPRDS